MQANLHRAYGALTPERSWPGRLLIIQLGQIGDCALTMPLVEALKNRFGKSHICLLTDPINEGLASRSPIDKVFSYASPKYSRSFKAAAFPREGLDGEGFENALWLRGDLRTFLWVSGNRLPMRCLSTLPNPLRSAWVALLTKRKTGRRYRHFIDSLGTIVPEAGDYLSALYGRRNMGAGSGRGVFIHIGSGGTLRRWPEVNFSRLCESILKEYPGLEINLLGSEADMASGQRILRLINRENSPVFNICGKIPLERLQETLKEGRLYIGFDSGPMHIAALSGIPVVALMGPQSPDLFRPVGVSRVVCKDYYCSPCWQFACLHTQGGPGRCVLDITPEDVFAEASLILNMGEN